MNEINNGSTNAGFAAHEINDLPALLSKLRNPANPVGKFLLEKFPEDAKQAITGSESPPMEPEKLKQMLATELNQVCRSGVIYDPVRFAGVTLRNMTQGVLKKKHANGLDLFWSNCLLLQDAFRAEITPETDTLAAQWVEEGIHFRVYCEETPGVRQIGITYKIVYKTPAKWDSKHAKSLEKAKKRIKYLAAEIHTGSPPPSKPDTKERDAKAQAYDEVTAEVAKIGKHGSDVLQFIKDAVQAQLALGLVRPLLAFVLQAILVMPKPVQRMLLWPAYLRFKAFNLARQGVTHGATAQKNANIERFAKEIPGCEVLATQLLQEYKLNGDLQAAEPAIEKIADTPIPLNDKGGATSVLHADDVTAYGLLIWLRRLKVGWKTRRDHLDNVRSFYKYLRDELRAVAQTEKTVAHVVPRPKRKGKKTPVPILWFVDVWRILINLQDLESVFFVALGVFAGLHQAEIHRLVWEWDIIWKDGEPHQIFVTSGNGKEPGDDREGKYVDILFPLNKILLLGKGRKGKIISNNSLRTTKLMPLVLRLGIAWTQSIMRHTCATYMYGSAYTLDQVAKQLRDIKSTIGRYYLLHIPKLEAERLWTLPFDISIFEGLPDRLREWNWEAPLKDFHPEGQECSEALKASMANVESAEGTHSAKGRNNIPEEATAENVSSTPSVNPQSVPLPKPKRTFRHYQWPPNIQFLVLRWEMTTKQIASILGCRQTTVSAHAVKLGLESPTSEYWRLKNLGHNVEAMVPESVKQARLALQKLAAVAGGAGNPAPCVLSLLPNPETAITDNPVCSSPDDIAQFGT